MKCCKYLAVALLFATVLPACAAAKIDADIPIKNPGFEEADQADPTKPTVWRGTGDGPRLRLDDSVARSGKRSLRLERLDGKKFGASAQSVDATAWRGHFVKVTMWLKVKGATTGDNGVWLRVDPSGNGVMDFGHSYGAPLRGDTDWVERSATVFVHSSAERIIFGATNSSAGILWSDDVSINVVAADLTKPMSIAARTYLDDAIQKIRAKALNTAKVDWAQIETLTKTLAQSATTPADTYDAIRLVLSALQDGHSHFLPPASAKQRKEDSKTDDFGIRSELVQGSRYVTVPSLGSLNAVRSAAFSAELSKRINALSHQKACGWIVDLRANDGGNMWPMADGLSSLIGDGIFGYFVQGSDVTAWMMKGGKASTVKTDGGMLTSDLGRPTPPRLAVLTGPQTASSGEAIAVAFRGRNDTRSFGEPTRGLSTANTAIELSDGAMVILTVSVYADRTGKLYGDKITPDESTAGGSVVLPIKTDPTILAAVNWLSTSPLCK